MYFLLLIKVKLQGTALGESSQLYRPSGLQELILTPQHQDNTGSFFLCLFKAISFLITF